MNIGLVPLLATIISLLFALTVLDQFFARRRPYQLVWSIGLFMYAVSTLCEFWTEFWGINLVIYRLWYLFGAIFVASYLGMGTVYLLVRRRSAHIIMVILGVASIYATVRVFTASIDTSVLTRLTGKAMPLSVRLITPFFNTFGTVFLVGGALYSAWLFWRKRVLPHRVISNVLIALGAVLPALGGGLIRFGGKLELSYWLELMGIIIIFIGFLKSREVFGFYRFPLIHGFRRVQNGEKSPFPR